MRPLVKEPPRDGNPEMYRYWLHADHERVGWTNSRKEAIEWRDGFGPGTDVSVEDTKLDELVVHKAA
jgi:hypothetical protein